MTQYKLLVYSFAACIYRSKLQASLSKLYHFISITLFSKISCHEHSINKISLQQQKLIR